MSSGSYFVSCLSLGREVGFLYGFVRLGAVVRVVIDRGFCSIFVIRFFVVFRSR